MKRMIVTIALVALLGAVAVDAKPPDDKGKPAKEQADKSDRNDVARDITDLARITIGIDAARRLAVDNSLVGPGSARTSRAASRCRPGSQNARCPHRS